jgi:hypothetical protein
MKSLASIASVLSEIRMKHLLDTSLVSYHYTIITKVRNKSDSYL